LKNYAAGVGEEKKDLPSPKYKSTKPKTTAPLRVHVPSSST